MSGLPPSQVPTLALIEALATSSIPRELLDDVLDLLLMRIYETTQPASLRVWLNDMATLHPSQHGLKQGSEIEDTVSD